MHSQNVFLTIDGVDFPIYEQRPLNKKWFSHKFKRAGIRYDIALSIMTGKICWKFGGFRAGEMNDLQLARSGICDVLPIGERVIGDKIYTDNDRFIHLPRDGEHEFSRTIRILLARHETVNKRIKDFKCMRELWRHGWEKHIIAFNAVTNLVQLQIENGNPLFDVNLLPI